MDKIRDMIQIHEMAIEFASEILEGEQLEQFTIVCHKKFFAKIKAIREKDIELMQKAGKDIGRYLRLYS